MSESGEKIENNGGWVTAPLYRVANLKGGFAFKSKEYTEDGIPILRMGNITKEFQINWNKKKQPYFPEDRADEFADYLLEGGELIICLTDMSNTGHYLGTVAINTRRALLNQRVSKFLFDEDVINKKLLYYALCEPKCRHYMISDDTGSLQKNTSHKHVLSYEIIFPKSLKQQKQIVTKIEKLFSHIDTGITALNQTKSLLKKYRQSILKAAVTGELTKQWRKQNKNKLQPANQLLKQILTERRKKWEQQQLQQFHVKGKTPKDDEWRGKYTEPEYADLVNEIDLPGWLEAPFEIVGQNLDGKRIPLSKKKRETFKGEYPYYGACDIIDYVPEYLFEGRHLLIGEDGANLLSKSKPLAFVVDGQFWVNNHAHVIKCFDLILSEYIAYHIDSMDISPWVSGSAQPKLNQKNLNKIPIKLPSILEQKVIVDEINKRFNASKRLAEHIELQLNKAEKSKQSILAAAFSGNFIFQP